MDTRKRTARQIKYYTEN